jgi:hypothetical protein
VQLEGLGPIKPRRAGVWGVGVAAAGVGHGSWPRSLGTGPDDISYQAATKEEIWGNTEFTSGNYLGWGPNLEQMALLYAIFH